MKWLWERLRRFGGVVEAAVVFVGNVADACMPFVADAFGIAAHPTRLLVIFFCFLPCNPGTFNSKNQSTSCRNCALNTYTDIPQQGECKTCELGKYAQPGSSTCRNCPAGFSGEGCVACGIGKYRVLDFHPVLVVLLI